MTDDIQHHRRADYQATPWKNGGGVTHEVVRVPAGGLRFDWRVSVAQIDQAGPFSDFSGYRRHMALLAGDGVRLCIAERRTELRVPGDLVEFDGAEAVQCDLLGGSCTDLNLMVAYGLPARVRVLTVNGPALFEALSGETGLLCAVTAPLAVSRGAQRLHLGVWDTLQWQGGGAAVLAAGTAGVDAPNVVFFATIGHGRQSPTAPVGQ